jgi:peptidyl-prolyl cis-trans isomerase A (cyclophilin A)
MPLQERVDEEMSVDEKMSEVGTGRECLAKRSSDPHPEQTMKNPSGFGRFGSTLGVLALVPLAFLSAGCSGEPPAEAEGPPPNPLLQPRGFTETAPESYQVRFTTTKGVFVIGVTREWAPLGADRFYNLVRAGFYDGMAIHRVLPNFVAEWGIHGDPWVNAAWRQALMADEPVRQSNRRGRVTFSKNTPNSRTVQVFINMKDNLSLDGEGFSPFGEVLEGMDVVESFYSEYGDGPPRGEGVYQAMAIAKGDEYFNDEFPLLDRIETAAVVPEGEGG